MARGKIFNNIEAKCADMRARFTGSSERRRNKNQCPVCFHVHNEDVPEECWKQGLKSPSHWIQSEFIKYITQNKKGVIR